MIGGQVALAGVPHRVVQAFAFDSLLLGTCERCDRDGARTARLARAGTGRWMPAVLCDPCIAEADADPRYMVLRAL